MDKMTEIDRHEWNMLRRQVEKNNTRLRLVLGTCIAVTTAVVVLWAPAAMSEPDAPVETEYPALYQFESNTPAVAVEVNSNFATLHARADVNTSSISSNSQSIGNNTANIASNDQDIASNDQDIASLQSGKLDAGAIARHGSYSATRHNASGTTSTRMVGTNRSVCFLTRVAMEDVDSHSEIATCNIASSGGYWYLQATLASARDTDVWCSARCLTW